MLNVCDIQVMKPLLAEHGFHFSKAKGQNFLIASWVPEQIAEASGVTGNVGVLEIGPGIGPLTQQLCLNAEKVCAVELDTRLKPILDMTVGAFPNLVLRDQTHRPVDLWQSVGEDNFEGVYFGLLQGALASLADEERRIVLLHAVTGMKHREIAALLELPLPTVLSKYHRALKKMRIFLEGDDAR